MRIDSAFPSDYLKAADVDGRTPYTITEVKQEEIGQKRDSRPVIYFEEVQQGLVLNKTNMRVIADAYGLETDEWIGQQIVLYEKMVEFEGKEVPAIRVKLPIRAKPAPAAARKKPAAFDKQMDDEVPF